MANILILGGTQWLGRTLAEGALAKGHNVTALARGESGDFPEGVTGVVSDRDQAEPYALVRAQEWDLVVELTRFPAHAAAAVQALGASAKNWVFISSCSVYAENSVPFETESAAVLAPLPLTADYSAEVYGEAKVACEDAIMTARTGRALLLRAGLIGGPGDPSARTTYWPLRLADPRDPALLPFDDGNHYRQHVQVIDVRDLADFALTAGLAGHTGAVNAVGQSTLLSEVLDAAGHAAGTRHEHIPYPLSRLEDDGVAPWTGLRSLPLVLPTAAEYAGFAQRNDSRALQMGLLRRPLLETFTDIVAAEKPWAGRQLGAGLDAETETELLERVERAG